MHTLDLRGVVCPANFVRITLALEMLEPGEVTEIFLDDGEPIRNVPRTLEAEGHVILGRERKDGYHVLTVEKGGQERPPLEPVREYESLKITREGREPATDPVMVEDSFDLIVNGNRLSSIVTTPDLRRELAVGYMVTEGAVRERRDIEEVTEQGGRVYLTIRSFDHFDLWYELRSSGCIGLNWDKRDDDIFLPVKGTFGIDVLLDSLRYLFDRTQDATGGAHSASLVDGSGRLRYKALDIGRHNAIDKVVGMAFLAGEDLSSLFLVSSGRQPAGMVMKAVRAGIPLIVTKSAPISSGIDSARRANLTLCCYGTGEKIKVFSAPERIEPAGITA